MNSRHRWSSKFPAAVGTLLLAMVCTTAISQETDAITLWSRNFDTAPVDKILALALHNTEDLYQPVKIQRSSPMEYHEAIESLKRADNAVQVLSAATSIENDSAFLTVRFPVLKGLLGHRLCLIRKGDKSRFENVLTLYDFTLKNIKVCQGESWPDTQILQRNGLPLVTSNNYLALFKELQSGSCDCFLRGAQEILEEYRNRSTHLEIEPTLRLLYAEPGFFYINKRYPDLAARLELGLLRALDDGSYDRVFNKLMQESIEALHLPQRHTIQLVNPIASELNESLQGIPTLWFQD